VISDTTLAMNTGTTGMRKGSLRRAAFGVLAALAWVGLHVQAQAAASHASFSVGATVRARTLIQSESSPRELEVSAEDVRRGYVELHQATRLLVTNTSPVGYALDVWPEVQVFKDVAIRNADSQQVLDENGGEIIERGVSGAMSPLVLDFRFTLAPGVVPGRYPWPLKFQVRPLSP